MRALCMLRDNLVYRKDAFLAGLEAAGYRVVKSLNDPGTDDLLVIWNRYGMFDQQAKAFEARGANVVVTENGHLGKGWNGGQWYAMALNHHAGAGEWKYGGPSRWDSWNVKLAPWKRGEEIIIFAQRGIGEDGIRSPQGWAENVAYRLSQKGIRARIRPHPGPTRNVVPLEDDLTHARGCVTWHSGAATIALMLGVPVWYESDTWICAEAGRPLSDLLTADQTPKRDDAARLKAFRRLAWAMWTLEEVSSGEPFRHLLQRERAAA